MHRAQLGAERLPCNAQQARTLNRQYICSNYFSETIFTFAEKTCLNKFAVPSCCAMVPLPHSTTHPEEPSLNSSFWRSSYFHPYIFLDVHNLNV
jgi:hypothetical protein